MKKYGAYHLKITVTNGKVSKKFYDKFFGILKWKTVYEDEDAAGYSDGDFTLWVIPSEKSKVLKHSSRYAGYHHFSVRVPKKSDVDRVYRWCLKNKVKVTDKPKVYPKYSKNYYAIFFLDPNGLRLEVTFR